MQGSPSCVYRNHRPRRYRFLRLQGGQTSRADTVKHTIVDPVVTITSLKFIVFFVNLTIHIVVDTVAHFFFTRINGRTAVFEHAVDTELHAGLTAYGCAGE